MRLLTWNIRGGLGMDGVRSLRRIADVIRAASPDVVCLQEVHRRLPWSGLEDQPRLLAEMTGLQALFQSNFRVGFGGFGNAVLSGLPVVSFRLHRLPNRLERRRPAMRFERRGALHTVVQAPWGPVGVLCTHWSLVQADRLESAVWMLEALRSCPPAAVLAGDLNADWDSPEVSRLREAGLVDAGGDLAGPTYPARPPIHRLDYVLHTPRLRCVGQETLGSDASDHLPVLAVLEPASGAE